MAKLGEIAIEITPELNSAKVASVFKSIGDKMKNALKAPTEFFSKTGTLATGANQMLEIVKKIGDVIEGQRKIVDDISGQAGSISDFAQSVGLEGQEAKLQYVITQLAAGGLGGSTSKKMLEEFQKKVASGQVDIGGMNLLDAFTSALADVARFAPGSAEYLQRYKQLFNEEVKITGDIGAAIKAYETRDVGAIGTKAGFEKFGKSLYAADWAESEKEFLRQMNLVDKSNSVFDRGGFEAVVEAEKLRLESELEQARQISKDAIIGAAKVMTEVKNVIASVSGKAAELAGNIINKIDAIINILSGEGTLKDAGVLVGVSKKEKVKKSTGDM